MSSPRSLFFLFFTFPGLLYSSSVLAWNQPHFTLQEDKTSVSLNYSGERGDLKPHSNPASHQSAQLDVIGLSVGHGVGDCGPFLESTLSLNTNYFASQAESLGATQFHPDDRGGWVTLSWAFQWSRTDRFSLGSALSVSEPVGYDIQKFSNPRVDQASFELNFETRLTELWKFRSLFYGGWGLDRHGGSENAPLEIYTLVGYGTAKGPSGFPMGVWFGPGFEYDITQRYDPIYDSYFGSAGSRHPIRVNTFSVAILPYFSISPVFTVELGYVHKFSDLNLQASEFLSAGIKGLF